MTRRIGILYNPISGRGRGTAQALAAESALRAAGCDVLSVDSLVFTKAPDWKTQLAAFDCAVIAGGDGTLMHFLPALIETGTPVYVLPAGNQSLFATAFGMDRNPKTLVQAVTAGKIEEHCVPSINGIPFFTMASIGLDASVIEAISKTRSGTVSNWSYVLPTVRAILAHGAPVLTISVDGKEVVQGESGFFIAANHYQYALGIRFAPEADSEADEITVRLYPYRSFFRYLFWCWKCRFLDVRVDPACRRFAGKVIEVSAASPGQSYPVQADGEFAGTTPAILRAEGNKIKILRVK